MKKYKRLLYWLWAAFFVLLFGAVVNEVLTTHTQPEGPTVLFILGIVWGFNMFALILISAIVFAQSHLQAGIAITIVFLTNIFAFFPAELSILLILISSLIGAIYFINQGSKRIERKRAG